MKTHIITPDDLLWSKLIAVGNSNNQAINPAKTFLKCGILLEENGNYISRAICYTNPHHTYEDKNYMSVGYVYVDENYQHFKTLMEAVHRIAIENKFQYLLGPMNGSTWNSYRLVTTAQENPFLLEPVTPSFMVDFYRKNGWESLANYHSQSTNVMVDNWEKLTPRYEAFINNDIKFENFDKSKAESVFAELGEFCNEAFANNFLFSPIKISDFVDLMKPTIQIIDPDLTIIARNVKGKIAGFVFSYQDLLNQNEKTLIVKTLARNPESIYKGIGSVLCGIMMNRAIEKGFTACIHALMLDTNVSTHISDNFKANEFRKYTLFSKEVK